MAVGKTMDAGWEIGVSRTLDAPIEQVWDLIASAEGTAIWLGAGVRLEPAVKSRFEGDDGLLGEVRGFRPHDRIRLTHQPPDSDRETTVQVAMRVNGDRTMLRFHQERMADADEREVQRLHWTGVMDRIAETLSGPAGR